MLPDRRSFDRCVTRMSALRQTRSSMRAKPQSPRAKYARPQTSRTKCVKPQTSRTKCAKAVKVPSRLISDGMEKTQPMSPMCSVESDIPPIQYECPHVNVFQIEGMLTSIVAKVFGIGVESHRRLFPQGRSEQPDDAKISVRSFPC